MAIYALGDRTPTIHPDAYVHPDAVVIGSVVIGARSSVWPSAVVRGDYGTITIGEATSVQDGAVIHATAELATEIGSWVVIGHLAHIEGAVVEDRSLIGVGSAVLHRARIGEGATVGAGAVVTNDMNVPPRALAVGVPATIKPDRSHAEVIVASAQVYVDNTARYAKQLRRLD
ncbi:gamma carbonic anhydrase family protein [Acidiferrimicrobium sp. IK]|uniref:gamma carbonic anhydrase family protein n=1 Tax=Acidiferrimicrobium sp. IK TaxID=2871700 RepID=UPI0021CB7EA8|nr:gamma carbonic anhydrase family protein [Acidiferrimicrobium sp. IK]MCU4184265.1 gamma carbonic anhydrase family protein [Acidiferrimicrobium sp. IK]